MKTDAEILNEIEDFLVNNFGEDDEVGGTEAVEMLIYISKLIDQRPSSRAPARNINQKGRP